MATDLSSAAALLYRAGTPKDYPLSGVEASIGYDSGNAVRVAIEGVSRRHARITYDGEEYFIEDAGSSNGTFLNGIPVVRRERLRHLDILGLGRRTELVFVRRAVGTRRTRRRGIVAVWLQTIDGPEAGERREIPRGLITLGRAPSNNVVVRSELVSKAHARIERLGVELIMTDLQSANGTFVNGKPITTRVLEDGDEINLGKARTFRVQVQEGEIETLEINAAPTIDSTGAGLPTDWKTRLEWSPEEMAAFEWARGESPQAKAATADKAKVEAARAREQAKPKAAPAAAREKPAEKPAPVSDEGKAGPAAAAQKPAAKPPEKPESKPVEKASSPQPKSEPAASKMEPAAPKAAPPAPQPGIKGGAPATAPAAPGEPPVPPRPAPTASRPGVETLGVGSRPAESKPSAGPPAAAPSPGSPSPARPETRPAAVPAGGAPQPAAPPSGRSEQTIAVRVPPPVPAPLVAVGTGEPRIFLEGKLQSFSFAPGDHDVGRVAQCAVRLDTPQISRRHAVLHVTADEIFIEDLKSANGTFVNGKRVTDRHRLDDGDELRFGDLRFQVRVGASRDLPQA